jgi:hypothetical protein
VRRRPRVARAEEQKILRTATIFTGIAAPSLTGAADLPIRNRAPVEIIVRHECSGEDEAIA